MKNVRQSEILRIIQVKDIDTQEQLLEYNTDLNIASACKYVQWHQTCVQ